VATQIVPAPQRADHPASRLTAPLPPAAVSAMRSLERRLATPAVVRAVTVYETAAVHAEYLGNVALSGRMSDLDAESLAVAEELMAGSRATLAAAGMLHLVEVEHEKVKDPLPTRPRGPHPQRVTAAV
jgi:hypothetical protein